MRPLIIVKFIGAWLCIVLAALAIGHIIVAPAMLFAILAIAFAQAPATW